MITQKLKDLVLLDAPMPIKTPRLILRPFHEGDGAQLNAAKLETWDQLKKVFQWADTEPDQDLDEAYARKAHASYILRQDFNLVSVDPETDSHLMYIGIHPANWQLGEFQIGYWVRQSAQRQGYATEAANALIRYGFNQLGANRLNMCHVKGNTASQKIITSLGFDHEGIRRNSLLFAGGIVRDAHWYSRIDAKNLPDLEVTWP
jgi:RimJ/RimL family protein N-acetyltransferase